MMKNNYFFKNTEQKERCSCNYIVARNKEFILKQDVNSILNMKRVDLDES